MVRQYLPHTSGYNTGMIFPPNISTETFSRASGDPKFGRGLPFLPLLKIFLQHKSFTFLILLIQYVYYYECDGPT